MEIYPDLSVLRIVAHDSSGTECVIAGEVTPGLNSSSKAILFIHGFLGHPSDWNAAIQALHHTLINLDEDSSSQNLESNCSYYAVTFPGFSGTPAPPREQVLSCFQNLLACAVKKVASIHSQVLVVAYSMGARVLLSLLRKELEENSLHDVGIARHLAGIILVSGQPGIVEPHLRSQRVHADEQLAQRIKTEDWADFLRYWYQLPLFQRPDGQPSLCLEPQTFTTRVTQCNPSTCATVLRAMSPGCIPHGWIVLPTLTCPVGCLVGQSDLKYQSIATNIQSALSAQYRYGVQIIPSAGHAVHLDAPISTGRAIAKFLEQISEGEARN